MHSLSILLPNNRLLNPEWSISNSAARQLFVYTKNSNRKYYVICGGGLQIILRYAEVGKTLLIYLFISRNKSKAKLRLCCFDSHVLWISLESLSRSPPNMLFRLNCHIDKQPVVGDLFFAGLRIAGNSPSR